MIKNIHVAELKPGMQVVNLDFDWQQHPFLYSREERVESEEDVRRIQKHGYREVYVDLPRSGFTAANGLAPTASAAVVGEAFPSLSPRVTLREELPRALDIHQELVRYSRRFMAVASTDRLSIAPATPLIERVIASLERNADALVCLSRLFRPDAYIYTHCANVCILAASFALHLGEDGDNVFTAALAGLFHDVGKAFLPPQVLVARRALSKTERALVRWHPSKGRSLLATVPGISPDVLMGALEHHERHDGSGYPKGLSGNAITLMGRMIGIADTFDALSSHRPYKGPMFPHRSLGMLYRMRDKEFSAELVDKFVRMIGVYPVGSVVELADGYRGVVVAGNPASPAKPTLLLALDALGRPIDPVYCDLATESAAPIEGCLPSEISGVDPCWLLGLLN